MVKYFLLAFGLTAVPGILLNSAPRQARPTVAEQKALLGRYCVGCHTGERAAGGLRLDATMLDRIPAHSEAWERVVRKLRAGAMPPVGAPHPDRQSLDNFTAVVEETIDAAAKPDPGPPVLRRLNRSEYAATVRDLLDLEVDVSSMLPADDANHGFDNSASSLKISPALLEGYLNASRRISRMAVGDPLVTPGFTPYRVRGDAPQDQHVDGLPLGTRGGLLIKHHFLLDGDYVFKAKLLVNSSAKVRGLDFPHEYLVTVDGAVVFRTTIGGPEDEELAYKSITESEAAIRARLETKQRISAGPHVIGATFRKKTSALPDGALQPYNRSHFDPQEQRGVPVIDTLSIGGPFDAAGPGDTPSRRKLFSCRPSPSADPLPCAKAILSSLTRRAYRRPVTGADLELPLSFFQQGWNGAGSRDRFDAGIESALRLVLTSPEFLFRAEKSPAEATGVYTVSDLELASRLAFFLWNCGPDDELLNLATQQKLKDPVVMSRQVRRMIQDPRAKALVESFAGQWLQLRNLRGLTRDFDTFPDFDDSLRRGFQRETELFFESIVREDRSVLDFLRADYTYLNERVAKHYGIANVTGSNFRRVSLAEQERRGLLGQGSMLAVTSYATRTSPVLRGQWLLENVLGAPAPPPPPGIPALVENVAGTKPRSVRERLEEHRKRPACASCHNLMDPLGFALENFDATGAWRNRSESREALDTSGMLVDGTKVDGPVALRNALLSRPEAFAATFTEKLMTYALGRGVEYYDRPVIRRILRESAPGGYTFSSLILGIAKSIPFQQRRAEPQTKAD